MTILWTALKLFVALAAVVAFLSILCARTTRNRATHQSSSDDRVPSRKLKIATTCDWRQVADDLDGDNEGDQMGASVVFSKDGRTVAVGSPGGLFTSLSTPGSVRIFLVGDNDLEQLGKTIDGEVSGDQAGGSVALSDDGRTVAIGSNRNDDGAVNAGQTRVYTYVSMDWFQLGQDIESEAEEDNSGISVALNSDGKILAVAALGNDESDTVTSNASGRGHVRVYQLDDENNHWLQLGPGIPLGTSVALSADGLMIVAGAQKSDANGLVNSGEVAVFRYEGTIWEQVGSRLSGEAAGDFFGNDVSISADGQTVAAGAWLNDSNGPYSGHARVFTLVDSEWEQLGNTVVGESNKDQAGHSVSLSADGRTLAVGAIRNDGRNGNNSGHARVFTLIENDWIEVGLDIDGEAGEDFFGISASLSGDGASLVVGGIGNDKNGIDAGHARVFTLDIPCPEAKEARIDKIRFQFTNVLELSESEIAHFEKLMEEWYEAYFGKDETISAAGVRNLDTNVAVRSQEVEGGIIANNTLTYDQNFTFVELSDSVIARDLLLLPFQDALQVQLYTELLAESIVAFGSVQSLMGPPELPPEPTIQEPPVSGPTPGPSSSMSGTVGLSKGGIAGIAVVSLVLGLAVAGLFFRKYKGSPPPIQEGMSNLPIGELIDMGNPLPPGSAALTTGMTVEAIAMDLIDAEPPHLPVFKDQVGLDRNDIIPSSTMEASVDKEEVPLDFKDQVRPYKQHSTRNDLVAQMTEERTPADFGPDFKDQARASQK